MLMDEKANPPPPDLANILEALRLSEERATAGLLALEIMHEIRNPLEALSNLTYLTSIEADNPQEVREYMRLCQEQTLILTEISRQTLGFARSSETMQSTPLLAIAEAALRIHQRTIDRKKVRLIKDLDPEATAPVHRGAILQVLSNLIVNAIDSLTEDGVLCVRLRKRHNEVMLTVSDNGLGISPEHSDKIFNPFFTTKQGTGNGLGLPLSKKIIDRHSGKIRMRSSILPTRRGTTFTISLPIAA